MIDPTLATDRLDETFANIIPRSLIPTELHPLYDEYEQWTDRAEAAQDAAMAAEASIERAAERDLDEAEQAALNGTAFAGTPNRDKARAAAEEAETQFRVAQRIQRRAARALLDGLRAHSDEISRTAAEVIEPALTEYRQLLRKHEQLQEQAAEKLATAAASLSFLAELRAGESKDLEVRAIAVERPSYSAAANSLITIGEQLEALSKPAESKYVHVIGGNGTVQRMQNNDTTKALLRAGHLQRATERQIALAAG